LCVWLAASDDTMTGHATSVDEGKDSTDTSITPARMSTAEANTARERLCRWVYHSATPFTVVEDLFFRAALRELNPRFMPPSRLDVANKFLDREHARLDTKVDVVRHACVSAGERPGRTLVSHQARVVHGELR